MMNERPRVNYIRLFFACIFLCAVIGTIVGVLIGTAAELAQPNRDNWWLIGLLSGTGIGTALGALAGGVCCLDASL